MDAFMQAAIDEAKTGLAEGGIPIGVINLQGRIFMNPIDCPFRTADREIAELVAELGGPRVVVSTDREVREAAEEAGALALWSEALVEWEKRR